MKIDYNRYKWSLALEILSLNNERLSRTKAGVSDTSSSQEKRPLLFSGERLTECVRENEMDVARFLYQTRNVSRPVHGRQVLELLMEIARRTQNRLSHDPGALRTWALPPVEVGTDQMGIEMIARIDPAIVPDALQAFAETVSDRWKELMVDPVPLSAWAEWELNVGSLHPFYDGCGRISRAFGGLLLMNGSYLLPLYDDRATYCARGSSGNSPFIAYSRSKIADCALWLEKNGSKHLMDS